MSALRVAQLARATGAARSTLRRMLRHQIACWLIGAAVYLGLSAPFVLAALNAQPDDRGLAGLALFLYSLAAAWVAFSLPDWLYDWACRGEVAKEVTMR